MPKGCSTPDTARREQVRQLREQGYTFDAIGKMLKPPVSRQGAWDLLDRHLKSLHNEVDPPKKGG